MNSFYGGKQGGSFIIAKTYSTIAEMLESFGKNNPDCPVNFDEYVLINTVNKNNPENGQIFRRGYNYNGTAKITTYQRTYGKENPYETIEVDSCGAEYIGTIVGPAGRAPIFNFGHYKEIEDATETTTVDYSLIDTKDKPLTKELLEILNKKSFEELGLSKGKDFYSIVIKNIPNGTRNAYYRYDKKTDGKNDWYVITKEEQQQNSNIQQKEIEYIQLTQLDNPTDEKIIEQLNSLNLVDLGFENIEGNNSFILTVKDILVYRIAYFCYDNKYKLNNQQSVGWYVVDTPPATGEDSYLPSNSDNKKPGLIPGITYLYKEDNTLDYEYDKEGKRHIALGINQINEEKNKKYEQANELDKKIPIEDMPYQDSIDWTYCTVRNENLEDSTAYIGFRFAAPIIEIETKQVDAYYNRNDGDTPIKNFENIDLITRMARDYEMISDENNGVKKVVKNRVAAKEDIEKHPFYSLWEIAIPKGIKGESICNFRVITAQQNVKALDLKDGKLQYDEKGYIKIIEDYSNENLTINKQDDIAKQRQIFVFDIISYDRVPEGDVYTIYAGDYNVFAKDNAVKLDHNGQLTFTYTHDDQYKTKAENWIHWIDKMHFNEDGTITITFNDLEWNVDQSDNQDKIENGVLTLPQLIKWITEVKLNEENGKFEIDFNYPEKTDKDGNVIPNTKTHYENDLTWLKYFDVDEQGNVTYTYTYDTDASISRVDPHFIKWIKEIQLNKETGHYFIKFNYDKEPKKDENGNILYDDDGLIIYGDNTIIEDDLTWVKNITINNEGTVTTDYTTNYQGEDRDSEGNRVQNHLIKWINKISLDKDNGHLYIEFNNDNVDGLQTKNIGTEEEPKFVSVIEQDLTWVKDIEFKDDGTVITDYTTDYQENVDKRTQSNFIKWIKNISLDEDTGHFIVNFNYEKEPDSGDTTQINQFLTWIKDIRLDKDGTVHWDYTTSADNHEEKNYIKWINDIIINDDGAGNGNQKMSVKYNTSNDYIDVGSPLNYVMRMAVNPENGKLLALYSDPEKRKGGDSYDGISGWTVLGNVKYSKSMTKELYDKTDTAADRVSDLIAGAVCYRTEVIE